MTEQRKKNTYLDNAGNFAVKYSSDSVKLRSLMSIINIPGFDEVSYTNTALDAFLKIAGNVLKHIGQTMHRQNMIADTILVSGKGVVNQLTLLNKSLATNIMNYGSLSTNLSSTYSNLGKVLFVAGLAFYDGMPGFEFIKGKTSVKTAEKLGWADNYHYISNVMKHGGTIYNLGGSLTGCYGKEIALIGRYPFLINL